MFSDTIKMEAETASSAIKLATDARAQAKTHAQNVFLE